MVTRASASDAMAVQALIRGPLTTALRPWSMEFAADASAVPANFDGHGSEEAHQVGVDMAQLTIYGSINYIWLK